MANPGTTSPPMVHLPCPACAGRRGGLVPDAAGMVPDAMGNPRHAVRISSCTASAPLADPPRLLSPRRGHVPLQLLRHHGQVCGAHLVHCIHDVHGHPDPDLHHRRLLGQCGEPDESGIPSGRDFPLLSEPAPHDPEPHPALHAAAGHAVGTHQAFLLLGNHRNAAIRQVPPPDQLPGHHRSRLRCRLLRHLRISLGAEFHAVPKTHVLLPEPEQQ